MRFSFLLATLLIAWNASAQTATNKLWSQLKNKREMLPGLHQEFEQVVTYKTGRGSQSSFRKITLDISRDKWRERAVSGSGDRIRLFDGQDLLVMEDGGDEYVRVKRKADSNDPEPSPYNSFDLDWTKMKELERRPCGFKGSDHVCIILELPVKQLMELGASSQITKLSGGIALLAMDSETGALVQSKRQAVIENDRGGYQASVTYSLTQMRYGPPPNATLFQLPESDMHQVKELTRWTVARIKKQLIGKPAPELEVMDIQGNPVSLAEFKGKTVLLDFWTTWCPPCLADAPALDKLFRKYGGKELMIVGISMNEERGVVENFLRSHPHSFPVVLTSENEMPRPYQIGVFPTYMVIGPDGTLTTALEGDQGFGELRKFLEKAGMEAK